MQAGCHIFRFCAIQSNYQTFMYKLLSAIFINIRMLCENSNSLESFNLKTPEFYISKLSSLQKRLQIIINELKMPLNYIFPSNFEEKYEEAKSYDQIDAYWIENYKEIIAFIIEGQMNTTLMRLSEKFRHQFGGHTIFWMDLICSFAQNEKYEQNFRIWQIIDAYKHCLHLQKGEYEKNRKFRRLTKIDIQVSKKLISSIYELKNFPQSEMNSKNIEEIMAKVQSNYNNHVDSNRKIVDFLRSEEHKNINLDFFESYGPIFHSKKENSNYNNSRAKKSQKQKDRQHNILKQRMITDFSVNFRQDKNTSLLRKIVGKNQRSESQMRQKKDAVEQSFKNLAWNYQNMTNLRQQLSQSKSKLLKKLQASINNVFISYSYLTYNNFYITPERQAQFQLDKPFKEFPDINYDNNDCEEYEEYQAEELQGIDSQVMTDDESLDSLQKEQLYEEANPYQMDSQDQEVFAKAIRNENLFFGKPWVLNLKNQNPIQFTENESTPSKETVRQQMIQDFFNQSSAICPQFSRFPLQIQFQDPRNQIDFTEEQIQILKKIFHMKSYAEVIQIIEQDESLAGRFPQLKLHKFIEKMTKKVKTKIDGKRVNIYHVIDLESKRQTRASRILVKKIEEIDESKSLASQITQIEEPDFHQEKISAKKQAKEQVKQNSQKPNSQSFANKSTLRYSKRTKKVQRKVETLPSDASETLSMRLRSRSSKPVYNINSLLGIVSRKKSESQDKDEDFEI